MLATTVTLFRASADWGEAGSSGLGSGAPALPGDATWLFRSYNTLAWTTPGGDFASTPSASQSVAGPHGSTWDGRTRSGSPAPPGIYLAVLRVDDARLERRIMLLR